ARFNVTRGVVLSKSGNVVAAGVQRLTEGWYRCWAAMPFATDHVGFNFALLTSRGNHSYRGDGKSGVLIGGAQLEPRDRPTGYARAAVTTGSGGVQKSEMK